MHVNTHLDPFRACARSHLIRARDGLYHPCDWPRGQRLSLFCGVDGEGDGPEVVVVNSLRVIE